jgi:hypothetical protein
MSEESTMVHILSKSYWYWQHIVRFFLGAPGTMIGMLALGLVNNDLNRLLRVTIVLGVAGISVLLSRLLLLVGVTATALLLVDFGED